MFSIEEKLESEEKYTRNLMKVSQIIHHLLFEFYSTLMHGSSRIICRLITAHTRIHKLHHGTKYFQVE